jgi:hypothetical protein
MLHRPTTDDRSGRAGHTPYNSAKHKSRDAGAVLLRAQQLRAAHNSPFTEICSPPSSISAMRAIIQFLCILLLRCLVPTTLATGPSPFASEQHALDFDQDPLFDDATYKSIMDLQRRIDGSEQHSGLSDGRSGHQASNVDSPPPHSSQSSVASAPHYVPRPVSQSSLVHGHATGSAGASPRRNSLYTGFMHSSRVSDVESMKHNIRQLARVIPYPDRTRKRYSSVASEIETLIEEPQLTGIPVSLGRTSTLDST